MKLPCAVVRDLLPLYAEEMTEPETQTLIKEHLAGCEACRQRLSQLETKAALPVETAKPLETLKKELCVRRWGTAAIAALCVFVALFTWFYHANAMQMLPWEEGLIEVKGVETRPYEEVSLSAAGERPGEAQVDVLVLKVDGRLTAMEESTFTDDDGTRTTLLQGWTHNLNGRRVTREYNEMQLYPVPDRLMYTSGGQQTLLWGEPLNGGMETLPRLALAFYLLLAAAAAAVLGILWLLLRRRERSWIARQLFFAPVSYLIAHVLIKGTHTASFFLQRDFFSILLLAAALYALLSLLWQALLRRVKTERKQYI